MMEYRRLGRSGLRVSALGLGAGFRWGDRMGEDEVRRCMVAAREAGVNFFDNAEGYGNGRAEVAVGNAIESEGWRREDLVVSTKIFYGGEGPNDTGLSHKHVVEGVDNSLRRLRLDYVDLVFCHQRDPDTPIEETVRAMDLVIKRGKAFYWGTSWWSAAEIVEADTVARRLGLTPPAMVQPQYNMFARDQVEREYAPLYRDLGLGATVFSPLAAGLLTGKYNDGVPEGSRFALGEYGWLKDMLVTPDSIQKAQRLAKVADELGSSMAQLALAWCLKNPDVSSLITGASRPEQIADNVKALEVAPTLTPDVLARIDWILGDAPPAS